MKIIDLLNRIANGEEASKKIKIKDEIWTYDDDIDYKASDDRGYLFGIYTRLNKDDLNEEIEIIEDKKIEMLELSNATINEQEIEFKINEIIKHINKGEDNSD